MARNHQAQQERIRELIDQASQARAQLARESQRLRRKLDIPARIRESLKEHPVRWLCGSLSSGIAASFLMRRRTRTIHKAPHNKLWVGLIIAAAKPLLINWLNHKLGDLLKRQSASTKTAPLARPLP